MYPTCTPCPSMTPSSDGPCNWTKTMRLLSCTPDMSPPHFFHHLKERGHNTEERKRNFSTPIQKQWGLFARGTPARSSQVILALTWRKRKNQTRSSEMRRVQEDRFWATQQQNRDNLNHSMISPRVTGARSLHGNVYKQQSTCYLQLIHTEPHTPEWTTPFKLKNNNKKPGG